MRVQQPQGHVIESQTHTEKQSIERNSALLSVMLYFFFIRLDRFYISVPT
jgi:hypothetical protein